MAIRTKRQGPEPNATERWMELAKDERRHVEAVRAYQDLYKNATLVEASRKVIAYHHGFKERQQRRE